MKQIRRILCAALAFSLLLVAVGCSGSSGKEETKEKVDFSKLSPSTALPAFSDEFQAILDNVTISKASINEAMGYVLAAYTTYDETTFCEYMYTQEPLNKLEDVADAISLAATEAQDARDPRLALTLSTCASDLYGAAVKLRGWCTHYAAYNMNVEDRPSATDLVAAVNAYANVFYGQKVL